MGSRAGGCRSPLRARRRPRSPPKERKPNTAAPPTADSAVPAGSLKASTVIDVPCGELPAMSLATMTIIRITISVTEIPSMPEQRARGDADVAVGEDGDDDPGGQRDPDVVGALPDARALKEGHAERAGLGGRGAGERDVGAHQRPAGEEAGLWAECHAGQRVHRAGVAEVPAQPDERVGDEHHADRREDERQRHGAADEPGRGRAVEGHRRGRGHDPDRDRDRLPEAQLAAQAVRRRVRTRCPRLRCHRQSLLSELWVEPGVYAVKIASGRKVPTTQLGTSTISWMRRSAATEAMAYASWRLRP